MNRVIFLMDVFNIYHSLKENRNYHKYKWLDLSKLAQCYVPKSDKVVDIYYFTAIAPWNQNKAKRHRLLIKALELQNVKIIYGEFKVRDRICRICKKQYKTYEEKQTDVNIALTLFQLAHKNSFDKAIIVSGDSDLIPSIKAVQNNFPDKKIGVVIPINHTSESLKNVCDFHMKMKEKHLASSILPKILQLGNNKSLICPDEWN